MNALSLEPAYASHYGAAYSLSLLTRYVLMHALKYCNTFKYSLANTSGSITPFMFSLRMPRSRFVYSSYSCFNLFRQRGKATKNSLFDSVVECVCDMQIPERARISHACTWYNLSLEFQWFFYLSLSFFFLWPFSWVENLPPNYWLLVLCWRLVLRPSRNKHA